MEEWLDRDWTCMLCGTPELRSAVTFGMLSCRRHTGAYLRFNVDTPGWTCCGASASNAPECHECDHFEDHEDMAITSPRFKLAAIVRDINPALRRLRYMELQRRPAATLVGDAVLFTRLRRLIGGS